MNRGITSCDQAFVLSASLGDPQARMCRREAPLEIAESRAPGEDPRPGVGARRVSH